MPLREASPATACCAVAGHDHWGAYWQRALAGLPWVVPGSVLALMPKCPVCVAGYVAVGTGLGISVPQAMALRGGVLAVCGVWLGWVVLRTVRGWLRRRGEIPDTRVL